MKFRTFGTLFKQSALEWKKPQSQFAAGALSFFTMFSLVPFFFIVVTITQYVGRPLPESKAVVRQLADFIGGEESKPVRRWLRDTAGPKERSATVTSIIILLIGASTVFFQLQKTLDVIWVHDLPHRRGWRHFVKSRFLSMALIAIPILFIFIFFFADTVFSFLNNSMGAYLKQPLVWQLLHYLITLALLALMFAVIFKLMSMGRLLWGEAWQGGAITAFLFTTIRALLRLYFVFRPVGSIYGSVGWAIVIPVWVYVSWQAFLFGAHMTWVNAKREA